jgi:D-3-phosphoglycerate dehydrogenase / 2-oxoglutarate reductase
MRRFPALRTRGDMDILLASHIDAAAIDSLRNRYGLQTAYGADPAVLRTLLHDREVLVFRSGISLAADVLLSAPALKLIVRAGSGTDNVDLEYVRRRGIRLVRIPGPGAQAVAELTFGLMLGVARNIPLADRLVRQGRWPKSDLTGRLLSGKVLGIVGVGNIGTRVGELAVRWDMSVIGCVEHPSPERARDYEAKQIALTDCDSVISGADFLTIHVPLKASTVRLIDARAIDRMRPGGFLINAARGGIVDEPALLQALLAGKLSGAALDVHEREGEGTQSPFADLPNVVLTPHIGAMASEAQREIGRRVVELIDAFAEGRIDEEARQNELVA